MAHRFFAHAGFLIDGEPGSARAPYREEFMLLDAAAHECSLEVKCRGFTFSATHILVGLLARASARPRLSRAPSASARSTPSRTRTS